MRNISQDAERKGGRSSPGHKSGVDDYRTNEELDLSQFTHCAILVNDFSLVIGRSFQECREQLKWKPDCSQQLGYLRRDNVFVARKTERN